GYYAAWPRIVPTWMMRMSPAERTTSRTRPPVNAWPAVAEYAAAGHLHSTQAARVAAAAEASTTAMVPDSPLPVAVAPAYQELPRSSMAPQDRPLRLALLPPSSSC